MHSIVQIQIIYIYGRKMKKPFARAKNTALYKRSWNRKTTVVMIFGSWCIVHNPFNPVGTHTCPNMLHTPLKSNQIYQKEIFNYLSWEAWYNQTREFLCDMEDFRYVSGNKPTDILDTNVFNFIFNFLSPEKLENLEKQTLIIGITIVSRFSISYFNIRNSFFFLGKKQNELNFKNLSGSGCPQGVKTINPPPHLQRNEWVGETNMKTVRYMRSSYTIFYRLYFTIFFTGSTGSTLFFKHTFPGLQTSPESS